MAICTLLYTVRDIGLTVTKNLLRLTVEKVQNTLRHVQYTSLKNKIGLARVCETQQGVSD